VQEKLAQPPVAELAPQGTTSFKIMLERPDPNAVEVVVVFVDGAQGKGAAPAAPPAAPAVAPAPPAADTPPAAPESKPAEAK
jgi:hypothetical protein